jgi:Lar family restriction alleviation protein
MGEQLKPCPFCGARAEILGTDHLPYVCCENCGGSSDEFRTAERAAEDWNRRTPSPAIKEMVEALEDLITLLERQSAAGVVVGIRPSSKTIDQRKRARAALSAFRRESE